MQNRGEIARVDWHNADDPDWLILSKEVWEACSTKCRDVHDQPFSTQEVEFARKSLVLSKSGGADGVPMQCIKHMPPAAVEKIFRILNLAWTQGTLPHIWRVSQLVPVPKSKPGAFRPIALISLMAIWADKTVTRRLTHFLEEGAGAIPENQMGFRRAMSAEMAAADFSQDVDDELQARRSCVCVFLDPTSTYDYVRHDVLGARLGAYNPPPHMWRWGMRFTKARFFQTRWGTRTSTTRVMQRGVPEGGALSPVL